MSGSYRTPSWTDSAAFTAARIAVQVVRERLALRPARTFADVPASVAAITPEWWRAVLAPDCAEAAVLDQRIVASSAGTHQRHRFALTWNAAGEAAGLPTSVFTKTLPTVVTRMIGGYNGTARAEGRFYRELRPALDIESPHGYHASFDRRSIAGINVLEDIAVTRGARFCDFRTEVTRVKAESMIDLLATLHARWYDDPALEREHRWLASFSDWYRIGARKMRTEHYTAQAIGRLAEVIPPAIVDRRDEIWPATEAAAAVHADGPRGLLHSDVHIGNWYQAASGAMGLCDWQCVARGHGSRDVAYLLASALEVEDRRQWERALLARYLDRFDELTGQRGDRDLALIRYRQQMLHALWMWTITLYHSPLLPAMQPADTATALIVRITTAMADLESLDAF